jgi:hypothetical protein
MCVATTLPSELALQKFEVIFDRDQSPLVAGNGRIIPIINNDGEFIALHLGGVKQPMTLRRVEHGSNSC